MPNLYSAAQPPRDDDLNRTVRQWRPGEPRPGVITAAMVITLLVGVAMVVFGVVMLTLKWDRAAESAEEAEYMAFVVRNVRIMAGINIILGVIIGALSPQLLKGNARARKFLMIASGLAIFFLLAGWVMQFTGPGQALLALGLAIALLLAYHPASNSFFDAIAGAADSAQGSK